MPTIEFKRSLWVRLVVVVAILVIPASLYFFTYFNTKYDFAIQQRFRTLNELERQFNRGLANFDNLFRFSKFKELTPAEKNEARQVVSDFRAYLKGWEDWEEGEQSDHETNEDDLRKRILHKNQEFIHKEINDKSKRLQVIWEESNALDNFLDEQIYSLLLDKPFSQLKPLLDRNKGPPDERSLRKTAYLDSLNALIEMSQNRTEKQRLQTFADQLGSVGNHLYKQYSKTENEKKSLEERLKAIEKEIEKPAPAVADGTTSAREFTKPPKPTELEMGKLELWIKYIHPDIEKWLIAWKKFNQCVHSGNPTDTEKAAQKCREKNTDLAIDADGIVRNLARELESVTHYLQELGTSPIYGNTRYSAVTSNNCEELSQDSRATQFSVITSTDPFHLSVRDACVNKFHTRYSKQHNDNGENANRVLEAQLPLRDLLQPDRALRYFDQILILNSEGRVVYRSGQEDKVSVSNDSGPPLQTNRNDFARFTDLSGLLKKVGKSGNLVEDRSDTGSSKTVAGSFSRVVEEPIGDMPHLFFLQPLRPSLSEQKPKNNSADVGKPWHVIGVVRKSQLLSDVSSVSLNAMAILLTLLLLMLLAIPLLKLRFAAVTEPISTAQVFLIGMSLILGTCIITLLLLDVRVYSGLKDRMDETAKQISQRMRTSFTDELNNAILANKTAFLAPGIAATYGSDVASTRLSCDQKEFRGINLSMLEMDKSYPPFELAYLLDSDGTQVGPQKTYRKETSADIKVPKRQYFLRARDGPLWHHSTSVPGRSDGVTTDESFFLERIFTYDHGFWLTALSMPTDTSSINSSNTPCAPIARVTLGVMKSFFATVLPPSFGFAVLEDSTGEVIYHSDNSRSLLENFYVETDNNESLITAVHARREVAVSGHYYGDGHRFYVAQLADTPWSLVVFYDKTLIRTVNFELLVSTITAQVIYVLMIFAGLLVFRWISLHKHWRFIWPRPAVLREYRFLALILLLSQCLAWLLTSNQYEKSSLYVIAAMPLYTLSLIAYLLDQKHRWRTSMVTYHWKRFVTSLILLLGLVAIWKGSLIPWPAFWSSAPHQLYVLLLMLIAMLLVFISRNGQEYVPEKNHAGQERTVRLWYLICGMLALVMVAVWPTKLLFDDIFEIQAEKLLRLSQHHVLEQVIERRDAISHDLVRINPKYSYISSLDNDDRGIYTIHNIYDPLESKSTAPPPMTNILPKEHSQTKADQGCGKEPSKKNSHIRVLTEKFPSYSPLSAWLHVMLLGNASDFTWCAKTEGDLVTLSKTSGASNEVYELKSNKIPMTGSKDFGIKVSLIAGSIFLFFLMLYALRTITRRILGLDFAVIRTHWELENIENDIEDWKGTRRIVLTPSAEFIDKLKPHLAKLGEVSEIDLSDSEDQKKLVDLATHMDREEHDVALLRSPRFFSCGQETREDLLQALEKLDAGPQTTLILCTDLFPWLNLALADSQLDHKDFTDEEKDRWQTLLSSFQSGYATLDSLNELTSIEALLHYECRNTELEEIRQSIESEPAFKRAVELQKRPWWNIYQTFIAYFKNSAPGTDILTARELISDVTQRAKHFHKTLWQCCTEEEKYILYRMAQGNMVNSMHNKLLERLLRLGLIRKDPDFRISSYSLQHFILNEETPEQVKAWEKQTPDSIWSHLRVPLLMLLLSLFVFLVYVGPNVIESIIGLVPAIILAGPLLLRFLSTGRKK